MKKKIGIFCGVVILVIVCGIGIFLILDKDNKKLDKNENVDKKSEKAGNYLKIASVKEIDYDIEKTKNLYAYAYDDGSVDIFNNKDKKLFHIEAPEENDDEDEEDEENYEDLEPGYELYDNYFAIGKNYYQDMDSSLIINTVYDPDGKIIIDNAKLHRLEDDNVAGDKYYFVGDDALYDENFKKVLDIKDASYLDALDVDVLNNFVYARYSLYNLKTNEVIINKITGLTYFLDESFIVTTKNKTYVINWKTNEIHDDYTLSSVLTEDLDATDVMPYNYYAVLKKDNKKYYLAYNQISPDKIKINDTLYADFSKCKTGAKLVDKDGNIKIDKCHAYYHNFSDKVIVGFFHNKESIMYVDFKKTKTGTFWENYGKNTISYESNQNDELCYNLNGDLLYNGSCNDYSNANNKDNYLNDNSTCHNDFCIIEVKEKEFDQSGTRVTHTDVYYKGKVIISDINWGYFDNDNIVITKNFKNYYLDLKEGNVKIDLDNPDNNKLEELAK